MANANQTSTAAIDIIEADLKGSCPRLNRKFDLIETQITNLEQSTTNSSSAAAFLNPMTGIGDMISGGGGGSPQRVAANPTTTRKFLVEQGTGAIGQAPIFDVLAAGDIPSGLPYAPTGYPGSYASVVSIGNTGSTGVVNIQRSSAILPAGFYIVAVNIAATASGGSVTLTGALSYTDPKAGANTISTPTLTTVSSSVVTLLVPVNCDGLHNLTIGVSKTGAGTTSFDLKVYVQRIA